VPPPLRQVEVHAQDGRVLAPEDTVVDWNGIDGR
jgi:hypothetical protein